MVLAVVSPTLESDQPNDDGFIIKHDSLPNPTNAMLVWYVAVKKAELGLETKL